MVDAMRDVEPFDFAQGRPSLRDGAPGFFKQNLYVLPVLTFYRAGARLAEVLLTRLLVVRVGDRGRLGAAAQTAGPENAIGECMSDIAFLAASIVFFFVAVLYVYGCERFDEGRWQQCLKTSFCYC